ncbi:MAG: hypothetical protein KG003_08135 [Bacteroidetes bacterium]|nr:hypothetical protein [Bacteroidota bacterium]
MEFDLRDAIAALDSGDVFETANGARPANDYLGNKILPNVNMDEYDVSGGSLTIQTTMAGLQGMDSVPAEGGYAEMSTYKGNTGKIGIGGVIPERMLRQLQTWMLRMTAERKDTTSLIQETGMNFYNKIIVQAILDREEWLKWQVLTTGKLDWTFNGINLKADYGVPTTNFLSAQTGNNRYGGTTSQLWADIYKLYEILNWEISAFFVHPKLLRDIMANALVNQLQFVSQNTATGVFSFTRRIAVNGVNITSPDPRDQLTLIAYGKEGTVRDSSNLEGIKKVPFLTPGALVAIGKPIDSSNVFMVAGQGSTVPPELDSPVRLGYGHVAPTTEGGGRPGRWGKIWVPENEPEKIYSRGVDNFLPVLEAEKRLAVASSQLMS